MKKIIFTLLLVAIIFTVRAQEQANIADLDFLYRAIQKMPSYKDQLKNDKSYEQLYQRLRKELNTANEFEVYQKLLQLIYPINDNHLGFYRTPDSTFKFNPIKPENNLTVLEEKLKSIPKDSLQGVYSRGSSGFILYQDELDKYNLVNIENGDLAAMLYKNHFGSYDAIQFLNSGYMLSRGVKLMNNLLHGLSYYKGEGQNFYNLIERKEKYEYKTLDEQTGYLSLGSFSSSEKTIKEATDFFNGVKSAINTKNLIVDVRNNGGGGYKNSRQFISFLNNFPGKIYILQNGYTISNAEQFVINLKGKKNVITLGETTKGMITYGSNYGTTLLLPSKRFSFYPTDMSGLKKELAYESMGVKPDVALKLNENWVTQTLKYIREN